MRQRGVACRPVRQMTGGAAFDEVLLSGARIPDGYRLGPEGGGWAVARAALQHERLQLGLGLARTGPPVDRLLSQLRPHGVADDPLVRQVAARLVIEDRCARYLGWAIVSRLADGQAVGPAGALAKLASGRVSRRYDELAEAMRGAGAMVVDGYTSLQLWTPATGIAGGTDEILRDVVAERILGLPRDPATDDRVPFRDVPRSG
jgi:acyl-CoA dehydrogenase